MDKLLNEVKQYRKEQAELLDWTKHNGHPAMVNFDEGGLNACDKIIAIIERAMAKADSTSEKDLTGMRCYNQAFNDGINAAAENAKIKAKHKLSPGFMDQYEIDKQSILKLLKP